MSYERLTAFKHLWTATRTHPCRAHVLGPRKATLDAMVADGFAKIANRGYVLTRNGHAVAAELMKNGWKPAD